MTSNLGKCRTLQPISELMQENYKVRLKSADLHELFFVNSVDFVLFEGSSSYKEMPRLLWSI